MFVFVQPMYSKQELNADSNYVVYTSLIRGMRKVRPDWHFVVIFPDAKSGYRYDEDGFFKAPNVSRIPQRISPRKHANAASYDGIWYDQIFRDYAFDVCWCNLVEVAGHIRFAGATTGEDNGRVAVVAAHNYVIHESLPYPMEGLACTAFLQLMGASLADWNVFNSDHCRRMFGETASLYLKEAKIREILERSSRIDYGTLEEGLIPDPKRAPNPVPIIAYNHRLQSYKNYEKTFDLLARLHKKGLKFKVRYMNNTAEKSSRVASLPFVEMRLCANREAYLKALRECDLNVTNSQHETFCIAAIESMALGQPLIAPDGITFPEITGQKANDYPYLFKSPDEQESMITKLIMDARERKRWGQILSEHVRRSYNQGLWAERYAALFEEITDPRMPNPSEDGLAFFKDRLRAFSGKPFREFYVGTVNKPVNGRVPFGNQSLPPTKALRMIRMVGGRCRMENGQQVVFAS